MNTISGLVRTARPRQWVKNVLVVAGPLAAGTLFEATALAEVLAAFACFCLASGAVYLLNDVLDVEADRAHPVKSLRPVAAGIVSPAAAAVTAGVLGVASVGFGALVDVDLAAVLAIYLAVQVAYCIWLKHEPVLDLAVVSSGFLLRVIAGGAATNVELSQWALLVAGFGSLFMVAGKRYSELHLVGEGESATRRSLGNYSLSYLRFVWSISAAATIAFYALWAFGLGDGSSVLSQLSVIPLVVALLRYAVDIDRGAAGEPEAIVLGDRVLQLLGLTWLGLFAAAVFAR